MEEVGPSRERLQHLDDEVRLSRVGVAEALPRLPKPRSRALGGCSYSTSLRFFDRRYEWLRLRSRASRWGTTRPRKTEKLAAPNPQFPFFVVAAKKGNRR